MNCWTGTGRLTADPEIKTSEKNGKELTIANFTLAVNRKFKTDGQSADFIRCVAFGKLAEVVRDYFVKGQKMDARGRITTGSYQNKEGQTVYTTSVSIEELEFGESKSAFESKGGGVPQATPKAEPTPTSNEQFMNVDDVSDEGLPFNL